MENQKDTAELKLTSKVRHGRLPGVVVVMACFGLVVSLVSFLGMQRKEQAHVAHEFEQHAMSRASAFKRSLDWHLGMMENLRSFIEYSTLVEPEEFHGFTEPHLNGSNGMVAIAWIPLPPEHGFSGRKHPGNQLPPPIHRDQPSSASATMIEPESGRPVMLSLDLSTYAAAALEIHRGNSPYRPTVTAPVHLSRPSGNTGVLIWLPVHKPVKGGHPSESVKEPAGFVVALLDLSQVVENAFSGLSLDGLDAAVVDQAPGAATRDLYFHPSRTRRTGEKLTEEPLTPMATTMPIQFADRSWALRFTPAPTFLREQYQLAAWLLLCGGILMTGGMCVYLLKNLEERARVEHLVNERTAQLQQEIADRMHAEQELREERASLARRVEERTQALREANEELARGARLKDEFMASMSHELRTPLNAVLGLSEALQEEIYGPLQPRQRQSLRTIEESGRHLLSLINDILDLSKIAAGKAELEIGPVSIDAICRASMALIRTSATKKNLTLTLRNTAAVPTLMADPRRMKQILVNLLGNAVKFTPENGSVGLDVEMDAARGMIKFTVWDTGIGIPPERQAMLFQPFVQLDSRLARQYSGTGLGLALVRRMAEMHGGGVSLSSTPGAGSRFTVEIPLIASSENSMAGPPSQIAKETPQPVSSGKTAAWERRDGVRILVADDNEEHLSTTADYLRLQGWEVIQAHDGVEAVSKALQERPRVIIMDIQMPKMDGFEAIASLRQDPAMAGTRVIALTALAMPGDRERCMAAGANRYCAKPMGLRSLVKVIEEELQQTTACVA